MALPAIGRAVYRKEAFEKVTGAARYVGDFSAPGLHHVALVASPLPHARVRSIDIRGALAQPGVRAVLTGNESAFLCGEVLEDRPPLARGKVRYTGEPVALVVADEAAAAAAGAAAVRVDYEELRPVRTVAEALAHGASLVHPELGGYRIAQPPIVPEGGTNIADHAKVRRGDAARAMAGADVVVEARYSLPQVDHAAMETRGCRCEILPDGRIEIHTSSQAPFEVRKMIATYFRLGQGQVVVHAPLLGGGFGGKAPVQLEVLAVLASQALGGRPVKLVNTREADIAGSPVGPGLEARIRLGAKRDGTLVAAELELWMDIGAYADSSPRVARAIASACTGPYHVDDVRCDAYCVYTNHTYATAWRGFGHMPLTFCVERTLDKVAERLGRDPAEVRRANLIAPGDRTPTQVKLTRNLLGDLPKCLDRVQELIGWSEGRRREVGEARVRGKGIACFWKTSSSPPNALSGAIVTFNGDGSVNLAIGAVEMGPGTKTAAAQILAERLQIEVDQVHLHMDVNTLVDPEHWKTVASMSTYMVGQAVLDAAEDAIRQLRTLAGTVLKCSPEDLEVRGGRVCLKDDPDLFLAVADIAHGYQYPDGDSVGGQVIGRGTYIMRHLTLLDEETGRGMPGPSWTVGAQAVEVELDTRDFTYRIVRAASVLDAGRVLNPPIARGVVMGGMCMGLGYGSRECMMYGDRGELLNDQLRTYKLMRAGEEPEEYLVEFIETPQTNAPLGARPIGEHGVIGMPAALASALSVAAGVQLDGLPLTPERIWRQVRG
jgi:CO/xanthine dehydrogenase Mo-binding subunit